MKTQRIKFTKTEAITIARLSLIECITQRLGIWTFVNERIQKNLALGERRRLQLGNCERMQTTA